MITLTQEQKDVVKGIIKDTKNEQIISCGGHAGTGKSTILCYLSELLPGYAVCSFTGKAANVLRKKGLNSSTIHSLIYKPTKIGDKIEFELKTPEELSCNGFLVDESSMISKDIYEDMLSFDKPIIFIGDHGQLEPVGSSINVMKDPMYKLETIHRNAGEIAHFADHVRNGKIASTFPASEKIEFVDYNNVSQDLLLNVDQIICAFNKFRVSKNNEIRKLLGYTKLIEKNEKVICLRNNKRLLLFNGMQGVVDKVNTKHPLFNFTADGLRYYDIRYDRNQFGKEKNEFAVGEDLNPFDYAYAVTCHKMQGDEQPTILVYEQLCDKWEHKRWAYTAASRAKEKVYWASSRRYIPTVDTQNLYIPDYLR